MKRSRTTREPGCPRCWTPMPGNVLALGQVHCGTCQLDFAAALFAPPEPPRVQPRSLEEGTVGESQCAQHARNAAIATCERCGAFMCSLCRIEADGKALCATCFDRLRSDGALSSALTTFRSWRTLGLHLSFLGFPLIVLGIVIGPAAVTAAIRGILQDKKNGDEGTLWVGVISVVFGCIVTVGGVFFALSFARAFVGSAELARSIK